MKKFMTMLLPLLLLLPAFLVCERLCVFADIPLTPLFPTTIHFAVSLILISAFVIFYVRPCYANDRRVSSAASTGVAFIVLELVTGALLFKPPAPAALSGKLRHSSFIASGCSRIKQPELFNLHWLRTFESCDKITGPGIFKKAFEFADVNDPVFNTAAGDHNKRVLSGSGDSYDRHAEFRLPTRSDNELALLAYSTIDLRFIPYDRPAMQWAMQSIRVGPKSIYLRLAQLNGANEIPI